MPNNLEDMITPDHLYSLIDNLGKVKLKNTTNRTEYRSIKKRKMNEISTPQLV